MARTRLITAVNEALVAEMERDPTLIVFGEDVELAIMGDTRGLVERFGRDRIRNSPICEQTLTGMAVGLASAGFRVVLHLMFNNFIYTGMDAIGNQMAKLRLMTGGQMELPITVIAGYGGGNGNAAQHSDTAYPALMNLGGIQVAVPTSSADAKGLFTTAVRGRTPTFFLEPAGRGGDMGEVPDGEHLVPFGKANVLRTGTDVTLVAIGTMVRPTLTAATALAGEGVSAAVIDPRTLVPFDEDTVLASVARTGRLVVVDEARDRCSAASQIAAVVADRGFATLRAPVRRVTVPDVALPYARNAEAVLIPGPERIAAAVRSVMERQLA